MIRQPRRAVNTAVVTMPAPSPAAEMSWQGNLTVKHIDRRQLVQSSAGEQGADVPVEVDDPGRCPPLGAAVTPRSRLPVA